MILIMKIGMNIHKIVGMISLLACVQTLYASTDKTQNQPDSVYIFPYPTLNDAGLIKSGEECSLCGVRMGKNGRI